MPRPSRSCGGGSRSWSMPSPSAGGVRGVFRVPGGACRWSSDRPSSARPGYRGRSGRQRAGRSSCRRRGRCTKGRRQGAQRHDMFLQEFPVLLVGPVDRLNARRMPCESDLALGLHAEFVRVDLHPWPFCQPVPVPHQADAPATVAPVEPPTGCARGTRSNRRRGRRPPRPRLGRGRVCWYPARVVGRIEDAVGEQFDAVAE